MNIDPKTHISFPTRRSSDLIGILGTGEVGNLLGSRLIENGHQVMMGGREDNNQKGLDFVNNHSSENAFYGTFAEASGDRKSTRLNSSHRCISYAVFCLKKKN